MRILLSGYYGFGNLGDEALLSVIVSELRTRYPYVEIEVLSARPQLTAQTTGTHATPRGDVRAVLRAIRRADIVLSGGGGLFQTATSLRSLLYYASIVRRAAAAGKTTLIFAQSIGPLDFLGRQVVRESVRGVAAATLRDERSCTLLRSLAPSLQIQRTADPVFLLDAADDDDDLSALGLGAESDPLVLVSVRPWRNSTQARERVTAAVDRLAAKGAHVGFVPLGGPADAEACTIVMRECRSRPTLLPLDDVASAARVFRRAQLVIGMRLHALIFAVRFGVPFLALAYDPKVSALCDDIAYPLAPLWTAGERADAPAEDVADEVWARRQELAGLVARARDGMQALARKNFATLDEVLAERQRPDSKRHEGIASS
ncbi:MAG: polysaccharide pyruvyl transferase CsaB [Candidatus Eremiobacteraeota bacterium]|nr:polysaccharide pyruvyl transferase CsaB [Candidatus Eremiobacteraeota bacterium]